MSYIPIAIHYSQEITMENNINYKATHKTINFQVKNGKSLATVEAFVNTQSTFLLNISIIHTQYV